MPAKVATKKEPKSVKVKAVAVSKVDGSKKKRIFKRK